MGYRNLIVEASERIATVVVNRPKSLNALNRETMRELAAALQDVAQRDDVGAILITGAGEKAFVAGADISEMREMTAVQAYDFARLGQSVLAFIEHMPRPVIGVINGYALGGGCELAMACDILVASEDAKFAQPEVNLGIIPAWGGTQRLSRLVGRNIAKELVLTGEMISARRAYEIGLVNRVVPQAALMETARKIARKILGKGPFALSTAKSVMNRGIDLPLESACALEAHAFAVGFSTADRTEGMTAFLEKRKAVFAGK